MDAATLRFLYEERKRIDAKKATRSKAARAKSKAHAPAKVPKSQKGKQVRLEVSGDESASNDTYSDTEDSGAELEDWEDDLNMDMSDTSIQSVITIAAPKRGLPMVIPSTSAPKVSSHSHTITPHSYVTRFRASRR